MSTWRVARRYARALFDVARERGIQPEAVDAMRGIGLIIAASPDLRRFMAEDRRGTGDAQSAIMDEIFKPRIPDLVWRLIVMLEQRGRLVILPAIAAAVVELDEEARGIVRADLATAVPVGQELIDAVAAAVCPPDATVVRITPRVDRGLIGGLLIKVRDTVYDLSLATRLRQAERCLAAG